MLQSVNISSKMKRASFPTLLLYLLLSIGSALSIVPLEAGSLVVQDKFLRQNTCIFKNADLHLTKEDYEKQSDIKALAALSHLEMDNKLTFQIFYKIGCPQHQCQLEFTIQRITPEVNPLFSYQLRIDYLIAQGLNIVEVNMTSNRQLCKFPLIDQQERENNGVMKQQKKLVAIGIPNGFNDLTLTGGVEIIKLEQQDLYVLKYIKPQRSSSKEWTLNQNFILYKVLFLPTEDMTALNDGPLPLFFSGFKSTLSEFITSLSSKQIQLFSIPLSKNEQFIDERALPLPQLALSNIGSHKESNYLLRIMLGVIVLGILEFGYLVYRNRVKQQRREAGFRDNLQMPDMVISFNEPIVIEESVREVPTKSQTEMIKNENDI